MISLMMEAVSLSEYEHGGIEKNPEFKPTQTFDCINLQVQAVCLGIRFMVHTMYKSNFVML